MTRAELLNLFGQDDDEFRAEAEATLAPTTAAARKQAEDIAGEREKFHELDLTAESVPLRPEAWARIEEALDEPEPETGSNVVRIERKKSADPQATRWRPTALLATAAALVLAMGLAWQLIQAKPPTMVAILVDDTGESIAIVEAFSDTRLQVTPLAPITPENAQVLELWTQPDPDGPPVSIAVMEQGARTMLSAQDLPQFRSDQFFAISVEPQGGSPTGLPTGPVIGQGLAQPAY